MFCHQTDGPLNGLAYKWEGFSPGYAERYLASYFSVKAIEHELVFLLKSERFCSQTLIRCTIISVKPAIQNVHACIHFYTQSLQ